MIFFRVSSHTAFVPFAFQYHESGNIILCTASRTESHVQVTKSSFESRMSSSTARADRSCQFLVLPRPRPARGPFSFFGICARHPFCAGDALTVLSSRVDRSKLKRVNRPLSIRIRCQRCDFIIGPWRPYSRAAHGSPLFASRERDAKKLSKRIGRRVPLRRGLPCPCEIN